MSQFDPGGGPARNNVYTALALIAVICLGTACGVVAWKSIQLVEGSNPFFIVPAVEEN